MQLITFVDFLLSISVPPVKDAWKTKKTGFKKQRGEDLGLLNSKKKGHISHHKHG